MLISENNKQINACNKSLHIMHEKRCVFMQYNGKNARLFMFSEESLLAM